MVQPKKKKVGGKKTIIIITASIAGVLLLVFFSGALLLNQYLNMVHYDSGVKNIVSQISPEPDDHTESDSSQIEVDAWDKQLKGQLSESSVPLDEDKNVFNVLLIGSDTRVKGSRGRSDSMILVSINQKAKKVTFTSLLRDIYLQIPGVPQGNRLNAANAFGGPALLLETVQRNFHIKVNQFISVDFFSFMKFIDQIGGVEIDVSGDEIKTANEYIREVNAWAGLSANNGALKSAGSQLLNGKQALSYARIRYVGNGDFNRTDRQRIILGKVLTKLKAQSISGLAGLMNTILPDVTTNMSKGELLSLMLLLPSYSNYTVDSWRVPVDGTFSYRCVRGMSVLQIDFSKNIAEMQKKIYG